MEQRELTVQRRQGTGKSVAKRLRRTGQVPAIVYGGASPVPVTVDPKDVLRIIHGHEGSTQLLSLRFAGDGGSKVAIIRDMQFDPVTEALMHVDLQEVAMDRAITVTVAVHAVGEPAGVREQLGVLNLVLHELNVSCLPGQIPERIDADVSALMIGDVLTVAQLTPPPGVRVLNDPGQAVATVAPPRAEEAPVAAAAAVVAPAEPEVLTERKPKEGAEEGAKEGGKESGKESGKKEKK
jgi:large subunit ribosomal protein L25